MPSLPKPTRITAAGLAAANSAAAQGIQIAIAYMAVGDAPGYTPTGSETALANERLRVPIAAYVRMSATAHKVLAEFLAADADSHFFATEIGFFLADGTLFALYSPGAGKTISHVHSEVKFVPQIVLNLSGVPEGSVTVTVDPTASVTLVLIAAEETARIAADNALSLAITNETNARIAGDNSLTTSINNLNTALGNEATTRANDDTALAEDIATEATARASADTALSNAIASIELVLDALPTTYAPLSHTHNYAAPDHLHDDRYLRILPQRQASMDWYGAYTFTVPDDVTVIYVTGSGAGGSGSAGTFSTNTNGHGGGSGGWCSRYPLAVTPGSVLNITIGQGALGGAQPGGNGIAGGATTIAVQGGATLMTFGGGLGGTTGSGPGTGGTAPTGGFAGYVGGHKGGANGGAGAPSMFGLTAWGGNTDGVDANGGRMGGGGGGGSGGGGSASGNGGPGGHGFLIFEFASATDATIQAAP